MRAFVAFFKKELLERIRSGRLWILLAVFAAIGIMNPATALLTPWILETFWDSLGTGIAEAPQIVPTALDSFTQFYKNIPLGLFALVLLESGILTKEYRSGTLIMCLSRGLARYKVIAAKALTLLSLYTLGYWLTHLVTYGYNAYYFDNSIAAYPHLAALYYYVFGLFVLALLLFSSVLAADTTGALLVTGGGVLLSYLLSLIPPVKRYLPTYLSAGTAIVYGTAEPSDYVAALIITLALIAACFVGALLTFKKKEI
jgi:ABC-2 type transport system permease protein